MDTIWQTLLFRLAEHAYIVVPILVATGVLGLGPIGRALARRLGGGDAERQELETSRWSNCRSGWITTNGYWVSYGAGPRPGPGCRPHVRKRIVR